MRTAIRILPALLTLLAAAWCAACLALGPFPHPGAAAVLALAGLPAAAAWFVPRLRPRAWGLLFVLVSAFAVFWSTVEPSNDRHWSAPVAMLPRVVLDGDDITVENVRNFQYRTETDFTPRYETRHYRLSELSGVDLVASYWMGDDIAHIFLSFAFAPGQHLAISIETRPEEGESYSTVTGFFRNFEIFYVVADERDLIGVRTNHRQDPPEQVYLYRIAGSLESARRVFLDYAARINELVERPGWYNTLTTNCTTSILHHTRLNPGRLPMSWKVLASGHVPEYLHEHGRVDTSLPFAELKQRSTVNAAARAAGDDAPDFSQRIREGLPGMAPSR